MSEDLRIVTHGVKELQKALKSMSADAPLELKAGFARIAGDVAEAIRPKVARQSGRAASSVKGRSSQRGGSIAFGGSAAPYMPWLDFGGTVGRGHERGAGMGAIKREWKGAPVGEGRYVYPTIREKRKDIIEATNDLMEGLAEKAGFEVRD